MLERLGKYELLEQIGSGGMAEVFLAKSFGAEGLEKILVIKRILPDYSENRRFVDMFISEAKIAVDLNHPNVVQIYDFGKVDGTYFLAMEFVDGVDLGQLLTRAKRKNKPFSVGDALFVTTEIAKGLHYAHNRKDRFGEALDIVHRDVSPQNVLISRDGSVKIVDFGIAKASSVTDISPHVVKGKFSYMSPEQASGKSVDHRSDIFSLGVVLFEMVCGRPLFRHTKQEETLSLVKSAVVPDIKSLNPEIPDELEAMMYQVLSREPDDRYADAREFQMALTRLLYTLPEIHDAQNLGKLVSDAEKHLADTAGEHNVETRAQTHTTNHTRPRTTSSTTASAHAKPNTPVTRLMDSITPAPAEIQTRERKEVVIVAGELMGLFELRNKMGQEKWLQVLSEFTRIIDSIAYKNSAVVHRVNEQGFVLLFGIPISSENDAELAVRVTLDLHEAVAGMNPSLESQIQLSAGIAVGNVVLEQEMDQTGRRFSWSFYGDDFELAERLAKQALAKEILVGGQLYRRIRSEYICEKVDHVRAEVGGEVQKIQAYLLAGLKTQQDKIADLRRSYRSFYGREIYLKNLRDVYREVMLDSQARCHVIVGREGIGKSTLVQEFLKGLDPRNVRVVRGVVPMYQRDIPFGSLATFLGDTFRLGDLNDLRKVRDTIRTRITALFPDEDDTEKEYLRESLGTVFGMRVSESMLESLSSNERRDRVFLSLLKVITRFSEKKPIILAMDDAQNIDTLSMEFAKYFFENTRSGSTLLILTAVDTGTHTNFPQWKALLNANNVFVEELEELTHSEAEYLVRELLKFHRIEDENLVQEILHRSGHNPLYIKEVVEILRDRGMLKDTGERRQIKVDRESPHWLPSNVEGLIRSRIDRLPLHLKVVLQRVALLWSPFSHADVRLVLPEESALDAVDALVNMNLLNRADGSQSAKHDTYDPSQTPPEERLFSFCNALTKEVASAGVVPEEAAIIHQTLASYLLTQNEEDQGKVVHALIARHFEGAGETDRAVEYYFEAADEALEKFGAAESLRLCDKVLAKVKENSPYHYRTLKIRAKALYALGLKNETEQALEVLEPLAEAQNDPDELADLYLQRSRFLYDHTELKQAREFAQKAADIAQESGNKFALASASIQIALISLSEGDREEALRLASSVAERLSSESDAEEAEGLVRALNLVGIVHRQTGRHSEALDAYTHALVIAKDHNLKSLQRFLLTNAGLALAYLGEFSEALDRYAEALTQCRRLGHRREEANLLINIGHSHLLRGEYEEAVASVRRGIYLARKTSANHQLADGLISMGAIYVEKGDLKKAEDSLHEGLRISDSIPNVYLGVHATILLAQVHLANGSADGARIAYVQAEDALERSQQAEMTWGVGYSSMLLARAEKILGNRDRSVEWSKKAVDVVNKGEIFAKEEILYHHAQILPDDEEHASERCESISRARDIVMERHDRIADEDVRKLYLAKDLNRRILNVAKVICD